MLFDSPNEVLKSEPLSEFQKDFIKTQLNNSRYSKLEYNKTEISPKVYKKIKTSSWKIIHFINPNWIIKKKLNYSYQENRKSVSDELTPVESFSEKLETGQSLDCVSTDSPTNSLITDDEYEEVEPAFARSEDKE